MGKPFKANICWKEWRFWSERNAQKPTFWIWLKVWLGKPSHTNFDLVRHPQRVHLTFCCFLCFFCWSHPVSRWTYNLSQGEDSLLKFVEQDNAQNGNFHEEVIFLARSQPIQKLIHCQNRRHERRNFRPIKTLTCENTPKLARWALFWDFQEMYFAVLRFWYNKLHYCGIFYWSPYSLWVLITPVTQKWKTKVQHIQKGFQTHTDCWKRVDCVCSYMAREIAASRTHAETCPEIIYLTS